MQTPRAKSPRHPALRACELKSGGLHKGRQVDIRVDLDTGCGAFCTPEPLQRGLENEQLFKHQPLPRQLQRVPLKRLADMDDGPASGGLGLRDGQLRRPATLGERQTAAVSGAAADIKAGDGRAQQPRQIFLQAVVIDALIRCAGRNNGADDPAKRCKISQIRFLPALSRAALQRRRSGWSTACR